MTTRVLPSTWPKHFPGDYLAEYDAEISSDERVALQVLVETFQRSPLAGRSLLDFGCGPTVHRILPAVQAARITLADLLPENMSAVSQWLGKDPSAKDWSAFTRLVLELEGNDEVSCTEIETREDLVRTRVSELLVADALIVDPLGPDRRASYDVVMACFSLEMVGADADTFRRATRNVSSLIRDGGHLIVMSLLECENFELDRGGRLECFPATAEDFVSALTACGLSEVRIAIHDVPEMSVQGYRQIATGSAIKTQA